MLPRRHDFLEKTLHRLAGAMEAAARADNSGAAHGFLQKLDPRGKLAGLLGLIFVAAAASRLPAILAIFVCALLLAAASGTSVFRQVARLWGGIFLFTGAIVLPAVLLTPGAVLFQLPWVGWTVSGPGLRSAAGLLARAETTATLAALLVLTTPWAHLLKALRTLRCPPLFIVMLSMTYRYIFLLLGVAQAFFEARRARRVGELGGSQRRQMAVSSAAVLLSKSVQLGGEVYEAMQARGYRGEVHVLDGFRMKPLDWTVLAAFLLLATALFALGTL